MKEKHLEVYDPNVVETGVKRYWSKRDISRIVLTDKRVGGSKHHIIHTPHLLEDTFSLVDIYPKLLYDVWYRFQFMNGHNIRAIYGYDTYSLSVEQKALSSMGLSSFHQVGDDSMDDFVRKCQAIALEDKELVEREYSNLAFLYDPKKFYSSYPSTFIDSCWWAIKNLYERGFLEKRNQMVPWCSTCNIPLSKLERSKHNRIINEYVLKFSTKRGVGRNFLVQIKEPWKLLGLRALLVHPDKEYCVVDYRQGDQEMKSVLLKDSVSMVMGEAGIPEYKVVNSFPGNSLEGMDFIHPVFESSPFEDAREHIYKVIASDDVPDTLTGIFPLIPGPDQVGREINEKRGFTEQEMLTEDGRIADLKHLSDFSGLSTKETDDEIVVQMRNEGRVFSHSKDITPVNRCSYCKTPFTYREDEQWFIKYHQLNVKSNILLDSVDKYPKNMGTSKHGNWISGADDMIITRRDGWGMPFPRWFCKCGQEFIPETVEELVSTASGVKQEANIMSVLKGLRKLPLKCPECNGNMEWEGRMLNSLALAAMSPWAQMGYPRKHVEGWWPGDIMFGSVKDVDGIFSTHLAIAADLFDTPPVERWVGHGEAHLVYHELDELVESTGKDPFRLGLVMDRPVWEDMMITSDAFVRARRILRVFWNLHTLFLKESKKRDFNPEETHLELLREYMCVEDKWIISRLENMNKDTKNAYMMMRFDDVVGHLEKFVSTDLAQWYIELARNRLNEGSQRDVLSVLKVLHESLMTVSKIMAPITPHISEQVYLDLEGKEPSILLCRWPTTNRLFIDEFIEEEMDEVRRMVEGILVGKRREQIPEKWPLKRIVVDADDGVIMAIVEKYGTIIKTKARVEKLEIVPPSEEWDEMLLEVQPNYNAIGKAYRQWVSRIALMLEKRPAKEIKLGIDKGEYRLGIEGGMVEIQPNMVSFERELPIGFSEVRTKHGGIYLDREIDPNIWFKQIAREIMLRLKLMRVDLGMDAEDEVEVYIDSSEDVVRAVETHLNWLKNEVRAREIHYGNEHIEDAEYLVEWNVAGQVVDLLQVYGITSQRHQWEVTGQTIDIGVTPLYKTRMIELYQSIPAMSRELGERLYDAGYTNMRILGKATAAEISSVDGFKRSLARRIVQVVKERGKEFEARIEGKLSQAEEFVEEEKRKKRLLNTLQRVEGIGPARAESIYNMGFKEFTDFIDIDLDELTKLSHIKRENAQEIVDLVKEEYGLKDEEHEDEEFDEDASTDGSVCPECEAILQTDARDCYVCGTVFASEDKGDVTLPKGLQKGNSYLMIDADYDEIMGLFKKLLKTGQDGLLITRQYPKKLITKYELDDVSVTWLSNVDRENSISPKNLEKFSLNIEQFLAEKSGIIILDGLDYLISNNDFRNILNLVQSLKDQVSINDALIIFTVNKKILGEGQMDMLRSELEELAV